jgi:hypothetical protein
MRGNHQALVGALLLWCAPALAQPLGYDFVDLRYVQEDFDGTDIGASGFALNGSTAIQQRAYVFGGFGRVETDRLEFNGLIGTLEFDTTRLGLGFRFQLQPGTEVNFAGALQRLKAKGTGDFSGGRSSDRGHDLSLGLRHLPMDRFEINLAIQYVEIEDTDETVLHFGGLLHLTPRFSLAASYAEGEDLATYTAGARLSF